jgi:uncharacterized protein
MMNMDAPVKPVMKGYYQLIEGHDGGFMFALRAGNHETVLESRVYWSRQAALDAVVKTRECSQDPEKFVKMESADGSYFFELQDAAGKLLGRGPARKSRAALNAGIASVQRNAASEAFRGLVRRSLTMG